MDYKCDYCSDWKMHSVEYTLEDLGQYKDLVDLMK